MNFFSKKWIVGAFVALIATAGVAQFIAGPRPGSASSTLPLTIGVTETSTNLVTGGVQKNFRIGSGGNVAFYAEMVADGATTDNVDFTFQVSQDGTDWFTPPAGQTGHHRYALSGTTPVVHFTNLWTSAALNNVGWLRLQTISNGHGGTIYFTNLTFYQH